LYPRDYRETFSGEMLQAFERAAEERRGQGSLVLVGFVLTELTGLLSGVAGEWAAKLTTGRTTRNRRVPAARTRVSRELLFAEAGARLPVPDDVIEAERRVTRLVDRMVHAIANHDFPTARSCSYEEREAREELLRLKDKYRIDDGADFSLLG